MTHVSVEGRGELVDLLTDISGQIVGNKYIETLTISWDYDEKEDGEFDLDLTLLKEFVGNLEFECEDFKYTAMKPLPAVHKIKFFCDKIETTTEILSIGTLHIEWINYTPVSNLEDVTVPASIINILKAFENKKDGYELSFKVIANLKTLES